MWNNLTWKRRRKMASDPDLIRENDPAPHASGESDVQTGNSNNTIPPAASAPSPPPPETHHHITYKKEKDWWDKIKPFIEIAGVLLLAVYTGYTIKMYRANRDAADAATSAAETASKTLIVSNRPWVTAQVTANGPLFFTPDGDAHLPITYKLSNVGNAPAMDVWSDQELYMAVDIQRDTQAERDRLCGETEKRSVNMGQTIFPGKDSGGNFVTLARKENIDQSIATKGPFLTPHIIVCVAYHSTLNTKLWLHTGMIYWINRVDERGLTYAVKVGERIPSERLSMAISFFRGIIAN